jgi:hypothetical protein
MVMIGPALALRASEHLRSIIDQTLVLLGRHLRQLAHEEQRKTS